MPLTPSAAVRILVLAPLSWLHRILLRIVRDLDDATALKVVFGLIWTPLLLLRGQRALNVRRLFAPLGWTRGQCAALARRCQWHFAAIVLDTARLGSMTAEEVMGRVALFGEDHLKVALGRKAGVLLIGNHVGNWRVTLAGLASRGYRISCVAYEVPVASIEAHQSGVFRRHHVGVAHLGTGASEAARRAIERGEIFAIFTDLCLRPARGAWFRFGHAALKVDTGPARLALRLRAPILHVNSRREPDGRYVVTIGPEIERERVGHDPDVLTQLWLDETYQELARSPEQWEMMSLCVVRTPDAAPLAPTLASRASSESVAP
jgi:KDO2-lipid IV(A) lauroyltransferase